MMKKARRTIALIAVLLTTLSLAGCDGNVGVGVSVGVPVGNHGYMSVGGTRWR
jgi:predicted small secreted protein